KGRTRNGAGPSATSEGLVRGATRAERTDAFNLALLRHVRWIRTNEGNGKSCAWLEAPFSQDAGWAYSGHQKSHYGSGRIIGAVRDDAYSTAATEEQMNAG